MQPEITDEIRLIWASRFQTSSRHEEQNYWAMDLVASTQLERRLRLAGMERALRVELDIPFELWSEIVAHHQTGQPAVWSFVNKLISEFPIDIDRPKCSGELQGK